MKERTLKEIEDDMEKNSQDGNIGKVMDLVDEHGNTYDRMFCAVEEGNLVRVKEIESLGVNVADIQFIKAAIKNNREKVVFYQVSKGANLHDVVETAKAYDNKFILQWAKFAQRNKMGGK